jgi:hypothetical protein
MASKIRITWEKVRVHKSESYGLTGEAGGSAEWSLYLEARIGGKVRESVRWEHDNIRDHSEHQIDRYVELELDGPLTVWFGGYERDDTSGSDDLPDLETTHPADARWQDRPVRYQQSAHNLDFDYTVHYTIEYINPFGGTITPGQGTLLDVRYSGLWDADQQRTVWSTGLTAAELNKQASELWGQGGRLAQLQPHVVAGQVRYNVIWNFTGARQLWNIDCDEAHFRKTTDENWSWSRPTQVVPFVVNGQVRYAVLWNEGQHRQRWHPNTDDTGFRAITGETWSWGRPYQVYAFVVGTQIRYSCLWNAGQHSQVWHPNCSADEARKLGADNWSWGRAHQIQPFTYNGQRRYSVLWNQAQYGQLWNIDCDQNQLQANAKATQDWARPRQLMAP